MTTSLEHATALQGLKDHLATVADLRTAALLAEWDQQTLMPAGGAGARAEQIATLRRLAHQEFIADETGRLLEAAGRALGDGGDDDHFDRRLVRMVTREFRKQQQVPAELVAETARATSLAQEEWVRARAESNFRRFLPHLERVLDLRRRYVQVFSGWTKMYDPLLDEFEPGTKAAQVESLFAQLKAELVPLVRSVADRPVDDSFLHQAFDPEEQWRFGVDVIRQLGFDFDRGRQDKSAHPFTTHFATGDVRLTTRIDPQHLVTGLFGTMHEGGHGMYEQGVDPALDRTTLSSGCSLGLHESQSRLWENIVGRGRDFWIHFYPQLQSRFPTQLGGVPIDAFYRGINRVKPSLIRVEADEVTYNLHILLRFEIEMALLEGKLRPDQLPEAWNDKMQEYLGVTPPDDARGVLQDVHWSAGLIGYFPTYTLGNVLSVQIFEQAVTDRPEIPESMTIGDFSPLLDWLRQHLHRHGRSLLPAELIERVTGGPIDAGPYLGYLKHKLADVYGV